MPSRDDELRHVRPSADAPLVTIVTPSFNQAPFIRATIESVLDQDYPAIEYIIQDGGSTDGALDVIREYGDRVDWISEPDRGQSDAINRGFRRAHGDIVAWVNSDDVLLPRAVSAVVEQFVADPCLALVYGDGLIIDVAGEVISEISLPEPNLWELVHLSNQIALGPAAFFRRSALASVGLVDETLRWVMDYDLFIRLSLRYPVAHVAEPIASVRVYEDTLSKSGGMVRYHELMSMLRRYSAKRYPPAAAYFLADTLQANLEGLRASVSSSQATRQIATRLVELCGHAKRIAYRHAHRVHEDGWVEPRASFMIRGPKRSQLLVRGEIPWELQSGQRLQLRIDGCRVHDVYLSPGPFVHSFSVENDNHPGARSRRLFGKRSRQAADGASIVQFRADKYFVPARIGTNDDQRKIAWKLESVQWLDADEGQEIPHTTR